jgi:hypothetical protein
MELVGAAGTESSSLKNKSSFVKGVAPLRFLQLVSMVSGVASCPPFTELANSFFL